MTTSRDPRRLADYGDRLDGILRGALDAERGDGADAPRLAAIEAKLAARLASPPDAGPEAPPAAPPAPAPPSGLLGSKTAWMLAGAALVAGGALFFSRGGSSSPPPADHAVVAEEHARAPEPLPPPAAPAQPAIATVSPADLPAAREPFAAPSARPNVRVPSLDRDRERATSEGEEIALLARAHEALGAHPADSLALCREHEQRFATGHFAQEREAVAIEALVYLNRRAEAERRFDGFRQRYPTSSHRGHLEGLFPSAASAPSR